MCILSALGSQKWTEELHIQSPLWGKHPNQTRDKQSCWQDGEAQDRLGRQPGKVLKEGGQSLALEGEYGFQ